MGKKCGKTERDDRAHQEKNGKKTKCESRHRERLQADSEKKNEAAAAKKRDVRMKKEERGQKKSTIKDERGRDELCIGET